MTDLHVTSRSANQAAPNQTGADEASASADASDRRRPGRAPVATELVPLLREPSDISFERDDGAPVRGIALSVLLSAPIYAGLFYLVRWLLF